MPSLEDFQDDPIGTIYLKDTRIWVKLGPDQAGFVRTREATYEFDSTAETPSTIHPDNYRKNYDFCGSKRIEFWPEDSQARAYKLLEKCGYLKRTPCTICKR